MNALDWIFTFIIIILAIRAFFKGFVYEIFSFASPIISLLVAILTYKTFAKFLITNFKLTTMLMLISFLSIFLIVFIFLKIISMLLRNGIEKVSLGGFDKFLGLLIGLIEGVIIVTAFIVILSLLNPVLRIFSIDNGLQKSFYAKNILRIVGPEISKASKKIPSIINGIKEAQNDTENILEQKQ